jgi:hypothetical protein
MAPGLNRKVAFPVWINQFTKGWDWYGLILSYRRFRIMPFMWMLGISGLLRGLLQWNC